MKTILFLVALVLAACGSGTNGGNGKDGEDGKDGASAKCVVVEKDGVKVLKCLNPDGSVVETEIPEGEDGSDGRDGNDGRDGTNSLLGSTSCVADFAHEGGRGYKLYYNVAYFAGDLVVASLNYSYYGNGEADFLTNLSVVHTKESPGLSSASIGNNMFEAKLVSKTSAQIVYKPLSQNKSVTCKYSGQ